MRTGLSVYTFLLSGGGKISIEISFCYRNFRPSVLRR